MARSLDFIYHFKKDYIVVEYDNLLKDPLKELTKAHKFIGKGTPQPQVIDIKLKRSNPLEGKYEGMERLEELVALDGEDDFVKWMDKYDFWEILKGNNIK